MGDVVLGGDKKRRGDTTIPRNAVADFGFSRILKEASPRTPFPLVTPLAPASKKTTDSSNNADRDMAFNQLTFASLERVSRGCDISIAP
jgi:hypothetical protein